MGDRDPLHIYCHVIDNILYLFENICLITLERGEMLLCIVLFEESCYDLTNVFSYFQSFCSHEIFVMLNLPILLVLVKR